MKDLDTLIPNKSVKIGNEDVTINEFKWPVAMIFLQKIGLQMGKLTSVDGKLEVNPEKITSLITGGQELSEWLILTSTDKDVEWLKDRTFDEGLNLLDAALKVNLRPDFFAKLKRIGARFMGANLKESPQPSTSSSGKDTPAVT